MKKYLSRKFILTVLSSIAGVATVLTQVGGKVGIIAGIVIAIVPTITYIVTEGVLDAKSMGMIASNVETIKEGAAQLKEVDSNESE